MRHYYGLLLYALVLRTLCFLIGPYYMYHIRTLLFSTKSHLRIPELACFGKCTDVFWVHWQVRWR